MSFGHSPFLAIYRLYFPGFQVQFPYLWMRQSYFRHLVKKQSWHITSKGETWVEIDYCVDYTLDVHISLQSYLNVQVQEQLSAESSIDLNITMSSHTSYETIGCFNGNINGSRLENAVLILSSCLKEKHFSDILIQLNATRWMLGALYFDILEVSNKKEYVNSIF